MDGSEDTTGAIAKAVTSVADLSGKVLDFISKVGGEPAEQAGGMLADRIVVSRWLKRVDYVDRVNKVIQERGLGQPKVVAPKFVLPMIERASLEDDEDLQKRWVDMLANAMDPQSNISLQTSFVEILNGLTSLDVRFLDLAFQAIEQQHITPDKLLETYVLKDKLMLDLNINETQYAISVFNLFRSGCMSPGVYTSTGATIDGMLMTTYLGTQQICLTPLGYEFARSVQPKL